MDLRGYAEEQAALRRVATLVARAAPPGEVFAAVTAEAGRLLHADVTALGRYDPDRTMTLVAVSSNTDAAVPALAGTRVSLGGRNLSTVVFETGGPARIDEWAGVGGAVGDLARMLGLRSAVGVPVSVEDRLWGIMAVTSTREEPLPGGTEARLAGAHFGHGSGLVGLKDRAEALGGRIRLHSPPGAGTVLQIALPLNDRGGPVPPAGAMERGRAAEYALEERPPVDPDTWASQPAAQADGPGQDVT